MLEKPVVSYRPVIKEAYAQPITKAVSRMSHTLDELVAAIQTSLEQGPLTLHDLDPENAALVRYYIATVEGPTLRTDCGLPLCHFPAKTDENGAARLFALSTQGSRAQVARFHGPDARTRQGRYRIQPAEIPGHQRGRMQCGHRCLPQGPRTDSPAYRPRHGARDERIMEIRRTA